MQFVERVLGLTKKFGRDENGAFAIMFGLMAIVLVAMGGAVVDYVWLEQARNRTQISLDSAALALQNDIFAKPLNVDAIKKKAQALLDEQVYADDPRLTVKVERAVANVTDGSLFFEARISMPTSFVGLVGVPTLNARIHSEATRKKLALEVALVLDNSGSMSYTGAGANGTRQRIQFLKDAANCATNILFYKNVVDDPKNSDTCIPATGAALVENVRAAVVPFTMYVNVGADNRNATWIDTAGASITSNDNFDNDDDQSTLPDPSKMPSRFTLFSALGENWRGCVEARAHIKSGSTASEYYDTDDTAPTTANTRFVPMFSPDMVDGVGGNSYLADSPAVCDRPSAGGSTCQATQYYTNCTSSGRSCDGPYYSYTTAGSQSFSSTAKYPYGQYGAHSPSCTCRNWGNYPSSYTSTRVGSSYTFSRTATCVSGEGYVPTGLSNRVLQERICKYWSGFTASPSFSKGPNADCIRTAIQPLTATPSTVRNVITSMQAEGGTNIHEGAVWGFRALSPTAPFSEGGAYGESTSKVMIIMTDGENTAYNLSSHCGSDQRDLNGNCYNSAYGFPYNSKNSSTTSTSGGNIERMGALGTNNASLVNEMNNRTVQTCTNAKAAGITIYTIGLATSQAEQSTQAVVEKMLSDCASSTSRAYFPQNPSELKAVFQNIANELSALRLAQ